MFFFRSFEFWEKKLTNACYKFWGKMKISDKNTWLIYDINSEKNQNSWEKWSSSVCTWRVPSMLFGVRMNWCDVVQEKQVLDRLLIDSSVTSWCLSVTDFHRTLFNVWTCCLLLYFQSRVQFREPALSSVRCNFPWCVVCSQDMMWSFHFEKRISIKRSTPVTSANCRSKAFILI